MTERLNNKWPNVKNRVILFPHQSKDLSMHSSSAMLVLGRKKKILNFLTASILILPMPWNAYYYEVITMCITMNVYYYEDTIGINPSCLANICPL